MSNGEFEISPELLCFGPDFRSIENSFEELCWKFHLGKRAYSVGSSKYLTLSAEDIAFPSINPRHCNVPCVEIGGKQYTTINGSLHYMYCASGSDAFTQHKVLRLLADGDLEAVQARSAPHHPDWDLYGDISMTLRDRTFWAQTWWFKKPFFLRKAPSPWKSWLLDGGILIPVDSISRHSLDHSKRRSNDELLKCRSIFVEFMPVVDVICCILYPDMRVNIIKGLHDAAWGDVIAKSGEQGGEYQSLDEKAFEIIRKHIKSDRLICFKASIIDGFKRSSLFGEVDAGHYMTCSNSAGLFGVDELDYFAVFSREQVANIFSINIKSEDGACNMPEPPKGGSRNGRDYKDEKFVTAIIEGIRSGHYHNPYHGTLEFLKNYKGEYGEVRGNSFEGNLRRISGKVRKSIDQGDIV